MMLDTSERKVLDHGYVKLVETWGSDERIIESARMSTGKNFFGWGPLCIDCLDPKSEGKLVEADTCSKCGHGGLMYSGDERLLRRMFTLKHTSPFEFAGITLEVQAPIMVFREWHRHRTQAYSEMSARYAPLPDMNYIPTVSRCMLQGGNNKQAQAMKGAKVLTEEAVLAWLEQLHHSYDIAEYTYKMGLDLGIPKELARLPVPVGRYSRMRATANLQNWLRFLRLRMDSAAQWEIREYAGQACEILSECFPRTMGLFGEELAENFPQAA